MQDFGLSIDGSTGVPRVAPQFEFPLSQQKRPFGMAQILRMLFEKL
jgi:hypothetical protein